MEMDSPDELPRGGRPAPESSPGGGGVGAVARSGDEGNSLIYHEVQEHIVRTMPKIYKEDIDYTYNYASLRRKADHMEWIAVATGALGSILAYLASFFDRRTIALFAGIVGTLALVLASMATYFNREAMERARQLNSLLRHFDIREVPDIVVPVEAGPVAGPVGGPVATSSGGGNGAL